MLGFFSNSFALNNHDHILNIHYIPSGKNSESSGRRQNIFTAEGRTYHSKTCIKIFIMAVLSLIVWHVLVHRKLTLLSVYCN